MHELTKEEKRKANRSRFNSMLCDDGIRCEPQVCRNCVELVNESNDCEDKFVCPHIPGVVIRDVGELSMFAIPAGCKYGMEHIVIGKQRAKTLTEEEVLDAMDEEIIEHMSACDMGIDEVLDYIENNSL